MNRISPLLSTVFLAVLTICARAQIQTGYWKGELQRQGNLAVPVVFAFDKANLYFLNAGEKIEVANLTFKEDSVFFAMPVFESIFKAKKISEHELSGEWWKGSADGWSIWKFQARAATDSLRFGKGEDNGVDISGKWAFDITRTNGTHRQAIGEFASVEKATITGTVRTPSGDYRYMDGIVRNDSLLIATFDGSHAFFMMAKLADSNTLSGGVFYTGGWPTETFTAVKNDQAALAQTDVIGEIGDNLPVLSFCFYDLDGKKVCLSDEPYQHKAIILQMMGSWCPNCMDETAWLSKWHATNKPNDVEIIAVAYELSEDFNRSAKSLDKFRKKFDVPYAMLISGARVADKQKTSKTLKGPPEIDIFPTTLFLNKQHRVVAAHSGFYGPASPDAFQEFQASFDQHLQLARQSR